MARFIDGPASGKGLHLQRSPVMLRVVIDRQDKLDALDQPDDKPRREESVYVYRIASEPIHCFVRPGGRMAIADYKLYRDQPSDEVLRDTASWQKWCDSVFDSVVAELRAEHINIKIEPKKPLTPGGSHDVSDS